MTSIKESKTAIRIEKKNRLPVAMHEQIEISAYQKAQARNFSSGRELDDWLAAEAEIDTQKKET